VSSWSRRLGELFAIGALGACSLAVAADAAFPRLSWSDELAYAVMARNVAEGRGVVTNFYDPRTVAVRTLPTGDVHMPGQALVIAASFSLFGPGEHGATAPARASYLACGTILYLLARRLGGIRAGALAALLFFTFPGVVTLAHTAMAELTVLLLAAALLATLEWCRRDDTARSAVLLATLSLLALSVRETLVVFLPVALLVLFRGNRRKPRVLAFAAVVSAGLPALVHLYRQKAPFPHSLSMVETAADPAHALADNVARNLTAWWSWPPGPDQWAHAAIVVVIALANAAARAGAPRPQRLAAWLSAYLYAGTVAGLIPLYPLRGWAAVRMLSFAVLPALVSLAVGSARLTGRRFAIGASLLVAPLAALSFLSNSALGADRRDQFERAERVANLIRDHAPPAPHTVLARQAFLYGWQDYPITVVTDVPDTEEVALAVERRLAPDLVIVPYAQRRPFWDEGGSEAGFGPYRPALPARPRSVLVLVRSPNASAP
jgi:hypothetical protein